MIGKSKSKRGQKKNENEVQQVIDDKPQKLLQEF